MSYSRPMVLVLVLSLLLAVVWGVTFVAPTTAQEDAAGLPAGAVAYWPLDEEESTTFTDVVGSHDATCAEPGCPASTPGIVGQALLFDGFDDGLTVPDPADEALDFELADSFAVEAWVNTTQVCEGNKVFIGKRIVDVAAEVAQDDEVEVASSAPSWWLGCNDANTATFFVRDASWTPHAIAGTTVINDGEWHHIVGVRVAGSDTAGQELRLYVDGVADEQGVPTTHNTTFANDGPLTMGYYNQAYYYQGLLDEVALYGRALTAEEIAERYDSVVNPNAPPESNTLYLPMVVRD